MIPSFLKPLFRLNFITFFILVNILLIITQTPMLMRFVNTPQDRIYPFVHTDWAHDYYLYLAAINQGINGDLLYHDPYTTEPTTKGIFYIFFTTTGQIARIFHLNPVATYHLLTIISFEMFIIFTFLLSQMILGKKYAFWGALFGIIGTISPTLLGNLKINFPINMPWWIMQDSFERLYALPHYNFSQALLLLTIILLIKFFRTRDIKYAYYACLTIFISGLILPSVLIPAVIILPASYFLYLLINFLKTKKVSSDGIILKGIGLIIAGALIDYFIIKNQIQMGFPWDQWTKWGLNRWNYGEPGFDKIFLLSFGIMPILSLPAVIEAFRKNKWELIFTSLWAVIPLMLLPFATPLEIAKIRLVEIANFVPFGILTAYTIFQIIPRMKILKQAGDASEGLPDVASLALKPTVPSADFEAKSGIRERQDPRGNIFIYALTIIFLATTLPVSLNILSQRIEYTKKEPVYDHIYIPKTSYAAIEYIKNNLPKDSAILSHEKYGIIIPAFAPTISYFGHVTQTMNYREKEQNVIDFFSGRWKEPEAKEFLTRNGINYVYYGWQEKELGESVVKYPFLKIIYQNNEATLYQTIF